MDERELLKEFLSQRDVSCPVCGYNVKNILSEHCPECGSSLELRLDSSDLHILPWIVGMFGAAIPAGFFLIVSVITVYFCFVEGPPPRAQWIWLWWFYALTLLTCLTCVLVVVFRRRFLKLDKSAQWKRTAGIAILCASSVVVYMTLFIVNSF